MALNNLFNLFSGGDKKKPKRTKSTSKKEKTIVQEKVEPEEEVDEGPPWWEKELNPVQEDVKFTGINNEELFIELESNIKMGNFNLIEIPDTVMRIVRLLNSSDFDYSEVEDLINRSGGLAGEVVKLANSSQYSRGRKVTRIRDALTRLGPKKVNAILYLHSSKSSLSENQNFNKMIKDIMDHSYAVAQIANYLSLRYYPDPDAAFLAGLLHDIGKLALLKELQDRFNIPDINVDLTESSFGDIIPNLHEMAGRFIAKSWHMPDDIVTCIANHHSPEQVRMVNDEDTDQVKHLTYLIQMSDIIARLLGHGRPLGSIDIFGIPASVQLGLYNEDTTIQFLKDLPKALK